MCSYCSLLHHPLHFLNISSMSSALLQLAFMVGVLLCCCRSVWAICSVVAMANHTPPKWLNFWTLVIGSSIRSHCKRLLSIALPLLLMWHPLFIPFLLIFRNVCKLEQSEIQSRPSFTLLRNKCDSLMKQRCYQVAFFFLLRLPLFLTMLQVGKKLDKWTFRIIVKYIILAEKQKK